MRRSRHAGDRLAQLAQLAHIPARAPYLFPMFLPPDQRAVPPRWEPPGPPKRKGDPATLLILLIALGGILAPVGGGTIAAMVWAQRKLW